MPPAGRESHESRRAKGLLASTLYFPVAAVTFLQAPRYAPKERSRAAFARGTTPPPAPFPSFPLQESRSASFRVHFLAEREFGLLIFQKPLQISPMFINDEQRRGHRSRRNRQRRSMMWRPQKINQQWHGRCRGDRPERHVAPENRHKDEQNHCTKTRERGQYEKHPRRRRDSLATLELQPDRKAVSQQHDQCGDHHPRGAIVRKLFGEQNRSGALPCVEHQCKYTRRQARRARDVGCPDVSASHFADVAASKKLRENQSKRNRPKEVSGDWNRKKTHRNRSEEHTSELQSLTNLVCRLLLEKKKNKKKPTTKPEKGSVSRTSSPKPEPVIPKTNREHTPGHQRQSKLHEQARANKTTHRRTCG